MSSRATSAIPRPRRTSSCSTCTTAAKRSSPTAAARRWSATCPRCTPTGCGPPCSASREGGEHPVPFRKDKRAVIAAFTRGPDDSVLVDLRAAEARLLADLFGDLLELLAESDAAEPGV